MQLQIDRMDSLGRGVARFGETGMIIDGVLPGEVVEVSEYTQRRGRTLAQDYILLRPAPARAEPKCIYFGECGGCQLQHAQYDAQLHYKQEHLRNELAQYGGVTPQHWLPPLASSAYHYRRRIRLSVLAPDNGSVIIGYHRKARSFLLDIGACPVMEPRLDALLAPLHTLVARLSIKQRLPQIEMSAGDHAVAVVFRHLLPLSRADREQLSAFADAYKVMVYTQSAGPESIQALPASQDPALYYDLPGQQLRLAYTATDFVQANAQVNRLLVEQVLVQLDVQAGDRVLDLYSGIGNFSLPLARHARTVSGIEGHPRLVAQAQENAESNHLHNVDFQQADLVHWSPALDFNKLLIDPPREGAIDVIKKLSGELPETIVYVSCLPKTLGRDARYLVYRLGYDFIRAGLVDMFPQTRHIEAIAVFQRR